MSTEMKMPSVKLFSAFGKDLKITRTDMPPCTIGDGEFTLTHTRSMKQYKLTVSDNNNNNNNNRSKHILFKTDDSTEFKHKSRNGQFTFTIYINKKPNILCGSFHETKTKKIIEILNGIFNRKTNWMSKENLVEQKQKPSAVEKNDIEFKRHHSSNVKKTYSKSSLNREPLKPVKSCSVGSRRSIFPSPSALRQKGIENSKPFKDSDDDCKITAVGAHKTSTFYMPKIPKPKPGAEKFLRFKYVPDKSKVKINLSPSVPVKSTLEVAVVGFENLGNTCYMNAILQCLLNIPNFYQELCNKNNIDIVEHDSLYNRLCNLGYMNKHLQQENMQSQKTALKLVKNAISSSAKRFLGYGQHDAHEFLCHCLDQLKEDLLTKICKEKCSSVKDAEQQECLFTCPIKDNFESTVVHSIKCLGCNEEIVKEEQCNDFSLVIPDSDENSAPQDFGIDKLMHSYFSDELIDYSCETCKGDQSVLSHHFLKLPRVLILHLKRYDIYHTKRSDHIPISKQLVLLNKLLFNTTEVPKSFKFEKETESSTLSLGVKRKLDSLSTSDLPDSKVPKQSSQFDITDLTSDNCRVGEQLDLAARDGWCDDKNKKESSFTRILDNSSKCETTRRGLDFGFSEKDISQVDEKLNELTSTPVAALLDENDDEDFQKALELSMREYEEQQRIDLESLFASNRDENNLTKSFAVPLETQEITSSTPASMPYLHDEQVLDNGIDNNLNGESSIYKLVGIVNHHGLNTQSGHYTCDCYDFKSKQWRNYDDSSVKDITESILVNCRSKSGYIVFYMHSSCYHSIASEY